MSKNTERDFFDWLREQQSNKKLTQPMVDGAKAMIAKMDELGFGGCTNTQACEMECPKLVSISHIARLNREFLVAKLRD